MTYTIYALTDPRTGADRYVGVTKRGTRTRLSAHIRTSVYGHGGRKVKTHKACWIRALHAIGLKPGIRELEQTDQRWREQQWIKRLRAQGADLTNSTNGGEGSGYNLTPEHIAKIVAAKKGKKQRPMDPAVRPNMARMPRVRSQDERSRIADKLRGHAVSSETREKIAASLRGRKPPEKAVENARKANTGKPLTDERKAKIASALKAAWVRRRAAA